IFNQVFLRENQAKLNLNGFSFEEISGFALKEFEMGVNITDQVAEVSGLSLATNRSHLTGDVSVGYSSLEDLMNFPEKSDVKLAAGLTADIKDAYFFSPDLANDTTLSKAAQNLIVAELEIGGSLERLDIAKADVNWGNSTKLEARGAVRNPMKTEELYLDL